MKKCTNISIKFQLHVIAALQCIFVMIFCIYLFTMELSSIARDISSSAYQSVENALTQLENDIAVLSRTTLFPPNNAIFSNDDTLCEYLRKGPIRDNAEFGNHFFTRAQTQMTNSSIDFIAIYDLEGDGVYFAQNDYIFRSCIIRQDAEWYHQALSAPLGTLTIYGASDFQHSGIIEKDGSSLCAVRSIVDPLSFKIIGICVAGLRISDIVDQLDMRKLYSEQTYSIYWKHKLIFSNMAADFHPASAEKQQQEIRWEGMVPHLYHTVSHQNGSFITMQTPFTAVLSDLMPFHTFIIVSIILILAAFTLTIFKIIQNILAPLHTLIEVCNMVDSDHLPRLPEECLPEELSTVFTSFNRMSARIDNLIHEVLIKNLEKRETELQLLRTQINPHYLYNTLEIMHMTAYKNKDYDAANMAELLGKNLQYGLRETTREVTLQEELNQVQIYLDILSYQYKNRIHFTTFIEPELLSRKVIKLLFQPMIENSMIHGFSSFNQTMSIDILGYRKEEHMILCVSDDGCGMSPEQLETVKKELKEPQSQSIGIRNVSRRLQLFYGQEYGLSIDSVPGHGTSIIVTLPIH